MHKAFKSVVRAGVPLRLQLWGELGLAFVAWTRVTCFERLAFKCLPDLPAFYTLRKSPDFKCREIFEAQTAQRHKEYLMRTKSIGLEDELQLHVQRWEQNEGRSMEPCHVKDLREKLFQDGLLQPDQATLDECARVTGLEKGATLAHIVHSFQR